MGRLLDEAAGYMPEVDSELGEACAILDDSQTSISVSAICGEFGTARELTDSGNVRKIRTAHVCLLIGGNAALVERLAGDGYQAIPNGWRFSWNGKDYPIRNSSSDEISHEFDIEARIS